jgi:hypothetical protein
MTLAHLCQDYLDKGEGIAGAFLDHVRIKLDGLVRKPTSSAKLLSSEDDEPQISDEAADGSAGGALEKNARIARARRAHIAGTISRTF